MSMCHSFLVLAVCCFAVTAVAQDTDYLIDNNANYIIDGQDSAPESEAAILQAFFEATGGQQWINATSTTWSGLDFCSYVGVTCYPVDEYGNEDRFTGHVQSIDLPEYHLVGAVPASTFQLPYLERLNVRENVDLVLSFKQGLDKAEFLKELDVGMTTVESLEGVEQAQQLEQLHITGLHLEGTLPTFLYELTMLKGLYANYNSFSGPLGMGIGKLTLLEEIFLFDSDLTGQIPSTIGNLANLETLALGQNAFSGSLPRSLGKCSNLKVLALQRVAGQEKGSGIGGSLPSLANLSQISELYLQNQQLTGSIPTDFIQSAPERETIKVDLSNNGIQGAIPGSLATKQRLSIYLADNRIEGLTSDFCSRVPGWMSFDVAVSGCSAILCSPGSWASQGRATGGETCKTCSTANSWGSTECATNLAQGETVDQRDVLMKFYEQMGGRYWSKSEGWGTDVPVCGWEGITCTGADLVSGLRLTNNGLSRAGSELPWKELFTLPALAFVDLSSNAIDFEFTGIGAAKNLQVLDLSDTGLASLDDVEELSATKIVNLNLASNDLAKELPATVFIFETLEDLDVSNNKLSGTISPELFRADGLLRLNLSGNQFGGTLPSHIGYLTNLIELHGAGNRFSGSLPKEIDSLTELEVLNLEQNFIDGVLPAYANLSRLISLRLSGNSMTGPLPTSLLANTERGSDSIELLLSDNAFEGEVPPAWASRFSKLFLDLSGNRISSVPNEICSKDSWMKGTVQELGGSCDAILCPAGTYNEFGRKTNTADECERCPDADYMGSKSCNGETMGGELGILQDFFSDMHGNDWVIKDGWQSTDDYCQWYGISCDSRRKVVRIELESNGLYGMVNPSLFKLQELMILNLAMNKVKMDIEAIGEAASLQSLNLSATGIDSLDGIGAAARLVELYATGNSMQGRLPEELFRLTNLKKLYLSFNAYKGRLSPDISALVNLEELHLYYNQLTGQLPAALGYLVNLRILGLSENNFGGTLPSELNSLSNLELLAIQREGGTDGSAGGDVGIYYGQSEDDGPGLVGEILSFSGLVKVQELYLGGNSLSGNLPVDFLDGIEDKTAPIQVDLISNKLDGTIPSSLSRFEQMTLYIADNKISGIPDGICHQSGWMKGKVGRMGCTAILCDPGTFNEFGRVTGSVSCAVCPTGETASFYGSVQCDDGQDKQIKAQSDILMKLYDATGGDAWNDADNWLDLDVSICQWYGVVCNEAGNSVERILLQQNGLVGAIPSSIYKLRDLSEINFAGNAITLSFSGIAAATNLGFVNLDSTGLTSLDGIDSAPGIKDLSVAKNGFEYTFPSSVFGLSGLQFLDMSDNLLRTTIPSAIGGLTSLDTFLCSRCGFIGNLPSAIGSLQNLRVLSLDMNSLYGPLPASIQNLQLLSNIDLSSQLRGSDTVSVEPTSSSVQANGFGFEGSLDVFSNLTQISELYLQNNMFSSSIPSSFLLEATAGVLQTVDLRGNRLTGAIPTSLARFNNLELLLANNMIEGIPDALCSLNWNGKAGADSSCDHILCNIGTVNGLGHATSGVPCVTCPNGVNASPYFGGTSCGTAMERLILDQLFMELNGNEWTRRDGWYSGADVCNRFGVTCDSKGLLTSLSLSRNGLRGTVSSRIWLLSRMLELDLSYNSIEVAFDKIGEMQSLLTLKLSGTNMRTLDQIGAAKSLSSLHVDDNYIFGPIPEELYSLTNLERLYLDHNQLTGSISESIGNLSKLEELYLSDNDLSGSLDNIQQLMNSRVLSLGHNNFTGNIPQSFSHFPFLEILNLQAEKVDTNSNSARVFGVTGQLPAFQGAPRLRELNLASNALSGSLPDNFLEQSNADATLIVNLDDNYIMGEVPVTLAKFSDLRLSLANNLIDTVPDQICSMTDWMGGLVGTGCDAFLCAPGTYNAHGRRLPNEDCQPCDHRGVATYYGTTFCGAIFPGTMSEFTILADFWAATNGPEWLVSTGWTTSPSVCEWYGVTCAKDNGQDVVTEINLPNNNLQWDASSIIFYLKSLKVLNIANNEVNLVFRDISNAKDLEELNFSGTRVTSLQGIGGASYLKVLKASRNAFYGTELPDEIFKLKNLVELDISYCGFVGLLSSEIASLWNLKTFNAINNDFSGSLPDSLASLTRLKSLLLSENNFVGQLPTGLEQLTALESLAIDARTRNTAGISGPLLSFANMTKLKTLDLGSNSLTGSIPSDFLGSLASSAKTLSVYLDGNLLIGQVPSSLSQFVSLNIDVADNEIESLGDQLCAMSEWWDGDVGRYGCKGLVCPAGTYSRIGRQSSDQARCETCPGSSSNFLGQRTCASLQKARNKEILQLLYDATNGNKWNQREGWKEADDVCEWFGISCGGKDNIEIESIALGANNLAGQIPSELFELPGLKYLWLYANPIDFRFDGIQKATSLTSLQLDSIGLKSLYGVGLASALVELDVRFNNFNGPLSDEIALLTNLETFFCGDSKLTGTLPSFNTNRKLTSIRLGGNGFVGRLPSFSTHPKLKTVDVSDNQLSGEIPDDFLAAADKSKPILLDLSDNNLSGGLPSSLLSFPTVTIYARDNNIESIHPDLCEMENWNEGDVDLYQCDGILCPPKSFAPKGRASAGESCIYCRNAQYFGSSTCGKAAYKHSSAPSRKIVVSFAVAFVMAATALFGL